MITFESFEKKSRNKKFLLMAENNGPKFNFIFLPPTPWLLMPKVYSSVCLSQSTKSLNTDVSGIFGRFSSH